MGWRRSPSSRTSTVYTTVMSSVQRRHSLCDTSSLPPQVAQLANVHLEECGGDRAETKAWLVRRCTSTVTVACFKGEILMRHVISLQAWLVRSVRVHHASAAKAARWIAWWAEADAKAAQAEEDDEEAAPGAPGAGAEEGEGAAAGQSTPPASPPQ